MGANHTFRNEEDGSDRRRGWEQGAALSCVAGVNRTPSGFPRLGMACCVGKRVDGSVSCCYSCLQGQICHLRRFWSPPSNSCKDRNEGEGEITRKEKMALCKERGKTLGWGDTGCEGSEKILYWRTASRAPSTKRRAPRFLCSKKLMSHSFNVSFED